MGQSCSVSREPPKTPMQRSAEQLEAQVEVLETKIGQADIEIRQHVAMGAMAGGNTAAKQRALQLLKMKKMYEQQKETLTGTHFNLECLSSQQQQADVALTAFEAMKAAQAVAKEQQTKMNIDDVDRLHDNMAIMSDDMKAISQALAANTNVFDDAALEAEYARLAGDTVNRTTAAVLPTRGALLAGKSPAPTPYGAPAPLRAAVAIEH